LGLLNLSLFFSLLLDLLRDFILPLLLLAVKVGPDFLLHLLLVKLLGQLVIQLELNV